VILKVDNGFLYFRYCAETAIAANEVTEIDLAGWVATESGADFDVCS
jgi:hypothetical protein